MSKSFNPHLHTHTRTYSYYLPVDQYYSNHSASSRCIELGVHIDAAKFQKALSVFLGTHSMKNYSGSIQYTHSFIPFLFSHRNKNLSQFYLRTMYFLFLSYEFSNHASSTPLTIGSEHYLHVLLNGNSFLYHQIRKMIGGAVAVSCGSWSFPYLQACIYFFMYVT